MTVSDTAGGSFAFSNLLVGDLWLCGGQSNMNRELKYTSNYAADAADAVNWPNIRLYYATRASAAEPSETNTAPAWELLTPAQIANRTAIGYLFARTLAKTTHANIPIGILDLSRGGSPAQMWFQNGKLAALGYTDAARAAAASGSYYNAMIHPVRRVPLAGVLWYQGESNAYAPSSELHDLYYSLFPDLIRHWRDDVFNRPALPFYFVQLANYANDTDYVAVRDAQQQTLSLPNTGMALALDIGLEHDLHPPDKATVALRLALHAFKNNYNIPTLADGPRLADATVLPGQAAATLAFANTQNLTLLAQTLNATLPGPERPAFELAGPDGVFHLATAAVSAPDTLTVASPQVSEPKQVRYLWHNTPAALLYNRIPSPVPGEPAIWLPAPPIRPTPLRAVSFNDPASLAQDDLLAYALIPGPDGVLPETGGDLSHLPQTALSDGTLSLTFTPARAGFTYELQRSTDLQNWTTLHTITTPAALPVTLPADLPVATTPRQFLRLKITPPQK
ncbi:MAG: sialate O-acetylesterase [Opitutaceae bacterium]|nr:sialate O-acetylesterase [Opitutaceae bacterium]